MNTWWHKVYTKPARLRVGKPLVLFPQLLLFGGVQVAEGFGQLVGNTQGHSAVGQSEGLAEDGLSLGADFLQGEDGRVRGAGLRGLRIRKADR